MRAIGHLPNQSTAAVFSDYLLAQGIANEIEEDDDGWVVWVREEEHLDRARKLLADYRAHPDDPQYLAARQRALKIRAQEERQEKEAARKHFDRRRVFRRSVAATGGRLTLSLIAVSVIATFIQWFLPSAHLYEWLYFGSLQQILHGQVWRLITPIFLHAGALHLLFNMLWLRDLGTMIEWRQSARHLAALVFASAALSNLAQYFFAGPNFLGMSGVVYALLGYLWIKGRIDPFSGLFVHQHVFIMMMIWLVLCLANIIPHVANGAHVAGLAIGVAWGYLAPRSYS